MIPSKLLGLIPSLLGETDISCLLLGFEPEFSTPPAVPIYQ